MSRLTITIASAVIVVLAAAYLLGPRLLLMAQVPGIAFDDDTRPPAPNYADPVTWAALPGPAHPDAADAVPAGEVPGDGQDAALVDVFYIHPTTFRSRAHWNQDLADAETNAATDMDAIARQASAFNACCRIYAPRYRQAAIGALYAANDDGAKAYALAYDDIRDAFRYYLDHYNDGRPFILVGHSQGTLHLQRLLEELVDASTIRPHFVAAYAIGISVPVGLFERQFKTIGICATPAATGCVVSWNTFGRDGDASASIARNTARYRARFNTVAGADSVCINPLTFDRAQPEAPASANLGALPGAPRNGPLSALKPGLVGAVCKDGFLYADIPKDPAFTLRVLADENLHFHDIDLFYKNIRDNAVLRANAFLGLITPVE